MTVLEAAKCSLDLQTGVISSVDVRMRTEDDLNWWSSYENETEEKEKCDSQYYNRR